MADFEVYFPKLLVHEGGFVNDPDDPGGATNKGITLKTFESYAESLLEIDPTLENLKNLTDDQAKQIYKLEYWDKVHGDDIQLQDLAEIVFDFFVNAGAHASELLQRTLNQLGASLKVDGEIGENTLKALVNADPIKVYRRYKQGRIDYYNRLVSQNPSLRKFLQGWLNRVNSFPNL